MSVKLIFDNGGGLTLQLPGFAHWYQDMDQAAEDVNDYMIDGNTDGWEGHEEESAELDPTYEQIRNGGYRVYSLEDILDMDVENQSWGNVKDFYVALTGKITWGDVAKFIDG